MPDCPEPDEIEVSVFGRGIGECIVVHCGQNRWVVVDSVQDRDGRAVAEKYLDEIGVPTGAVECIILTHWHEDHVRGATKLAQRYDAAIVSLPMTLMEDEFQGFLASYGDIQASEFRSGVTELVGVCRTLATARQRLRFSAANMVLIDSGGVRVDTLSPSPDDIALFLRAVTRWVTEAPNVDRVIPDPPRNDASVVTYIAIGDVDRILLGGDLEVTGQFSGWQFIRDATWQQRMPASLFKVPHHGSPTGHYAPVWSDLLTAEKVSVLAPYGRGHRKLPGPDDVETILGLCPASYSASALNLPRGSRQANAVERTLAEASIERYRPFTDAGHARFRKRIGADEWNVKLFQSACHLGELRAA